MKMIQHGGNVGLRARATKLNIGNENRVDRNDGSHRSGEWGSDRRKNRKRNRAANNNSPVRTRYRSSWDNYRRNPVACRSLVEEPRKPVESVARSSVGLVAAVVPALEVRPPPFALSADVARAR